MCDENNRFYFRWLDLLAPWLQAILITADTHIFQLTTAHTLGFSIFTSRLLATELNTETITSNHYEIVCNHSGTPELKILLDSLLQLTTDS
jgi:hypothetical protein